MPDDYAAFIMSVHTAIPTDLHLDQISAAAEMQVDIDTDGRILSASGAFYPCFGEEASAMVGRQITDLLSPAHSATFPFILAQFLTEDTCSGHIVELSNLRYSRFVMSGIPLTEPGKQLRLLFSNMPLNLAPEAPVQHEAALAQKVCAAALANPDSFIFLLELGNWRDASPSSPPEQMQVAQTLLMEILMAEKATAITSTRFALLMPTRKAITHLKTHIQDRFLQSFARPVPVSTAVLPLQEPGLVPPQVARTVCFALNQFASGGLARMYEIGFSTGLSGFVDHAATHAHTLRMILQNGRFSLSQQPILNLKTGASLYYEALLRLPPDLPPLLQSSFTFVTLAATVGLGEEMDFIVLQHAMDLLKDSPEKRLAVNISAHSLQSPAFRARLIEYLPKVSHLSTRLVVEVTECIAITDLPSAHATIAALSDHEVAICLDDFSLEQPCVDLLQKIRPACVKIDGLYVSSAANNSFDRQLLTAMSNTAEACGAVAIAKRLESMEQVRTAQAHGCSHGQGWVLGGVQ